MANELFFALTGQMSAQKFRSLSASVVEAFPAFDLHSRTSLLHEKIAWPILAAAFQNALTNIFGQTVNCRGETGPALALEVEASFLHEEIAGPFCCAFGFHHFLGKFLGCGRGHGTAQRNGTNQHSHLRASLRWAGKQGEQAEDDITNDPNRHDHRRSDSATDRGSGSFGVSVEVFAQFPELREVGNQPNQHQTVEKDEGPLEEFPKKAAFGLSYRVTAMRAVISFWGHVLVAARTCGQIGQWKILKPKQFTRESIVAHCGAEANARQGVSSVQIRGHRKPPNRQKSSIFRSSSMGHRRGAVLHGAL